MKCGKSWVLIGCLISVLIISGFYLTNKLINPRKDNPIITNANHSPPTSLYPPTQEFAGNPDKLLIVNTDPATSCGSKELVFSEQQLQALPQKAFKTKHTWATVAQEFSGPLLTDVIRQICPQAKEVYLRSLDQYSVTIDVKKVAKYEAILALKIAGRPLTVREKGLIWLMINTDSLNIAARTLDNMLVWQLYYIQVLTSD